MRKKHFLIFDFVWHKAIQELHEYDRLEMYEAIFSYAQTGKIPEKPSGVNRSLLMVICDGIPTGPDEDSHSEDQEDSDTEE